MSAHKISCDVFRSDGKPRVCTCGGVTLLCRARDASAEHECQMPHGHDGQCDWRAKLLTDDELRAECGRRATKPLNDGYGRLVRGAAPSHCVHGQRLDATCLLCGFAFDFISERDTLKAKVAEIEGDRNHLHSRLSGANQDYVDMKAERDEWKRRAEAAEALLASMPSATFTGRQMTIVPPYEYSEFFRLLGRSDESGPGIAKRDMRPDTSHWVDPWDFLEDV